MRAATVAFISSTLVGAVATPMVRELAHRYGALDHGLTSRKIHGRPVPRLGGIAIVLAFFAPLAALFFVSSEVGRRFWSDSTTALALFGGGLAIAALGILDDLRGCNAKTKFFVQFAVSAAMYWAGFRIDQVSHPFGPPISLGLFALPFTMFWIAGVINAMNLIDGLDGLAGGVAFIAVATIFTLAAVRGDALMLLFAAALGGAILGFLLYNFNPATIFMGDTGSMFLGFVLATAAIRTSSKSTTAVAIVVPILALGIPISDTLLAIGRRAVRGAPLFSADRGHLHHRLIDRGLSHRAAVLVIYGGATVFGAAALLVSFANGPQAAAVLLVMAVLTFLVLRALGLVDVTLARAALADRRRNLDMRASIRNAGEALRQAQTPHDVWAAVRDAARAGRGRGGAHAGQAGGPLGQRPMGPGAGGAPRRRAAGAVRPHRGAARRRPPRSRVDRRAGAGAPRHRDRRRVALRSRLDRARSDRERRRERPAGTRRAAEAQVGPAPLPRPHPDHHLHLEALAGQQPGDRQHVPVERPLHAGHQRRPGLPRALELARPELELPGLRLHLHQQHRAPLRLIAAPAQVVAQPQLHGAAAAAQRGLQRGGLVAHVARGWRRAGGWQRLGRRRRGGEGGRSPHLRGHLGRRGGGRRWRNLYAGCWWRRGQMGLGIPGLGPAEPVQQGQAAQEHEGDGDDRRQEHAAHERTPLITAQGKEILSPNINVPYSNDTRPADYVAFFRGY
ncbi:MAG: undecaprenyl/decaprenyl-phosphate alpha-N-acetylglucosaminyl 1-phosphate transferase [Anaeromyxobacter sp.]|nr:undecaprenyl/decaprenyl-phosphate alpha-N-acetylglucosaminyl 1-phosphate transferase [Anaeromyxobacter sp.]